MILRFRPVSDRWQDDQIAELRKEVETQTTAAEEEAAPMNMITSRSIALLMGKKYYINIKDKDCYRQF